MKKKKQNIAEPIARAVAGVLFVILLLNAAETAANHVPGWVLPVAIVVFAAVIGGLLGSELSRAGGKEKQE